MPFESDLRLAAGVVGQNPSDCKRFAEEYSGRILACARSWCRPYCERSCGFSGAGLRGYLSRYFGSSCDTIADEYTFILERLRVRCLPVYEGRCSLDTFLFPVLTPGYPHDGYDYIKLRADYVRHTEGRIVLPVWAEELGDTERVVAKAIIQGKDKFQIAGMLGSPLEEVESHLETIQATAGKGGAAGKWSWTVLQTAGEVPLDGPKDEDGNPSQAEAEIPDVRLGPAVHAEYRMKLQIIKDVLRDMEAPDLVLLRLRCVHQASGDAAAAAMGWTMGRVYREERRIAKDLSRRLTARANVPISLDAKQMIQALRGLFAVPGDKTSTEDADQAAS